MLACVLTVGIVLEVVEDRVQAESAASALVDLPPKTALRHLCKQAGLRVRWRRRALRKLGDSSLPIAWKATDGDWAILTMKDDQCAVIQRKEHIEPLRLSLDELEAIWSGEIVEVRGGKNGHGTPTFDVTWFIPELLRYRNLAWEVLAASAFMELLALLSPLFFQVVMDKVLVHHATATLNVLATVLVVVSVLEVVLRCLRQYVASQTALRIDARLGSNLFSHLMALPLSYFKARSVGVTVTRVRQLDTLREFLTGAINTLVIDLAFTGIFFTVMYFYSPFLTAIVAASIPCYFVVGYLVTPPLQRRIESLYRDSAVNNAFLNETLTGIETVKSLALEPQLTRRWEGQTRSFVASNFEAQRFMQLSSNLVQTIQKIEMVLVTWFGARMVIGLELSIGQLIAFNMMANHVSQPVVRLAELWRKYVQARVAIDRLGDVLNTPAESEAQQGTLSLRPKGDIRFEGVSFRYAPDAPPILQNLSLEIPSRAMVALVGPSGSGKSTIARLIQKLYHPDAGRILLDNMDLARLDAASVRRHMGVVLQENFLFNRSIRENIALTDPAVPLEKVIRAAEMAGAHEFILELPEGYGTILAEGGASLSGGQRQRIAIARALLADPAILIFDEATSALDEHSQAIIQRNLRDIRIGRTVLIIAHRLSTVRACDRIFVIDKGAVVETGDHKTLIAQEGTYARLWHAQSGRSHGAPGAHVDEIGASAELLPGRAAAMPQEGEQV
ncbi:type I secretion system permease/ATPase [Chelativorans salis]|uniref:Type I secretion system permease/ATPase n=1 Tax=Chelativorans salis TaxID=2978478 RepID=A0ABT2LQU0_9HYPH|nr:type I secretion system permease/ATPase [Chelativorans sp. EGI FJ00035]MCT7375559.1 type I secretion system permease/ATPase [Chelativorans sp. EGI FJ00035]